MKWGHKRDLFNWHAANQDLVLFFSPGGPLEYNTFLTYWKCWTHNSGRPLPRPTSWCTPPSRAQLSWIVNSGSVNESFGLAVVDEVEEFDVERGCYIKQGFWRGGERGCGIVLMNSLSSSESSWSDERLSSSSKWMPKFERIMCMPSVRVRYIKNGPLRLAWERGEIKTGYGKKEVGRLVGREKEDKVLGAYPSGMNNL